MKSLNTLRNLMQIFTPLTRRVEALHAVLSFIDEMWFTLFMSQSGKKEGREREREREKERKRERENPVSLLPKTSSLLRLETSPVLDLHTVCLLGLLHPNEREMVRIPMTNTGHTETFSLSLSLSLSLRVSGSSMYE